MGKRLFTIIKTGFLRTFDYEGRTSRLEYLVFLLFQLLWFSGYLWLVEDGNNNSFLAFILLVLPLLACAVRRSNDAGYSRGVVVLLVIAPYLLLPFLCFPGTVADKSVPLT